MAFYIIIGGTVALGIGVGLTKAPKQAFFDMLFIMAVGIVLSLVNLFIVKEVYFTFLLSSNLAYAFPEFVMNAYRGLTDGVAMGGGQVLIATLVIYAVYASIRYLVRIHKQKKNGFTRIAAEKRLIAAVFSVVASLFMGLLGVMSILQAMPMIA